MDTTNEQWTLIVPFLVPPIKKDACGRPRRNDREILDGILWILRSGCQWKDLPKRYPPYQTCHRRFQEWSRGKVFAEILTALAQDMETRGKITLEECFIDGTFSSAKKRGSLVGKTKRGKGTKIMAIVDQKSLPVAIHVANASPHEVTLVEKALEQKLTKGTPKRLVGDRAYDSDPLD